MSAPKHEDIIRELMAKPWAREAGLMLAELALDIGDADTGLADACSAVADIFIRGTAPPPGSSVTHYKAKP